MVVVVVRGKGGGKGGGGGGGEGQERWGQERWWLVRGRRGEEEVREGKDTGGISYLCFFLLICVTHSPFTHSLTYFRCAFSQNLMLLNQILVWYK